MDAAGLVAALGVATPNGDSDIRPAWCDVDGDGVDELLVGFGPASKGQVRLLFLDQGQVTEIVSLTINWYGVGTGETFPACGDLDGDGRDELVFGLGKRSNGWFNVLDDATKGFAPVTQPLAPFGWYRSNAAVYNYFNGTTHPAVGDIDGDGLDELILGHGTDGDGVLAVFDDIAHGLARFPGTPGGSGWIDWVDGDYAAGEGAGWPALGDVDGDGRDEIVIGMGESGGGNVVVLDDAEHGFAALQSPISTGVGRAVYPALADLDGDGRDELALAFDGEISLYLVDDAQTAFAPYSATPNGDGWVDFPGTAATILRAAPRP
jgi:hypothetical protein